jgi:TonB family protein
MAGSPSFSGEPGESRKRDLGFFLVAALAHTFLLGWKSGPIQLMDQGAAQGNYLVQVTYMDHVPDWGEPVQAPVVKRGFLNRMKSLVTGTRKAASPERQISDFRKFFAKKLQARKNAPDEPQDIASGKIAVSSGNEPAKLSRPNLKEKQIQMSRRDVPFRISQAGSAEAKDNVNQIAVGVGDNTSPAVGSLDETVGTAPVLKGKSSQSRSSGFSGANAAAPSGSQGSDAMSLADSVPEAPAISGSNPSASGTGEGTSSSGSAAESGAAGRKWTGGGIPSSAGLDSLSRNTVDAVQDSGSPAGGSKKTDTSMSRFKISGALAGRPVRFKTFPDYEMDCRVVLRISVDAAGHVLDGIIVDVSSGSPSFDKKVLQAMQRWMFDPLPSGQSGGNQTGVVTIRFRGV